MKTRLLLLTGSLCLLSLAGCNENQKILGMDLNGRPDPINLRPLRPDAVRAVQEGLLNPNGIMKVNSIEIVSDTGLRELMPLVTQQLKDTAVPVRFSAAVAVGDMRYISAKFDCKEMLNDSNGNVRIAAAYALTRIENTDYADLIRQAVPSDNQTLRANAVMLLGKLKDPRDLRLVKWALHNESSNDKVKLNAIQSVAMLGDERIYERAWSLLISKHPDDRVMGIRAMGALNTVESRDAIITMLDDEVLEVRLIAAEQLGRMGFQTGGPLIMDYFENTWTGTGDGTIATGMATMAIGRIGSDKLTGYLPQLLKSKSDPVRLRAAHAVLLLSN